MSVTRLLRPHHFFIYSTEWCVEPGFTMHDVFLRDQLVDVSPVNNMEEHGRCRLNSDLTPIHFVLRTHFLSMPCTWLVVGICCHGNRLKVGCLFDDLHWSDCLRWYLLYWIQDLWIYLFFQTKRSGSATREVKKKNHDKVYCFRKYYKMERCDEVWWHGVALTSRLKSVVFLGNVLLHDSTLPIRNIYTFFIKVLILSLWNVKETSFKASLNAIFLTEPCS